MLILKNKRLDKDDEYCHKMFFQKVNGVEIRADFQPYENFNSYDLGFPYFYDYVKKQNQQMYLFDSICLSFCQYLHDETYELPVCLK